MSTSTDPTLIEFWLVIQVGDDRWQCLFEIEAAKERSEVAGAVQPLLENVRASIESKFDEPAGAARAACG